MEPKLFLEPGIAAAALGSVQEAEEGIGSSARGDVGFVGEGARHCRSGRSGRVRVQKGTGRSQVNCRSSSSAEELKKGVCLVCRGDFGRI